MKHLVKLLVKNNRDYQRKVLKETGHHLRYDLRDYTNPNLVYCIEKYIIRRHKTNYSNGDIFNLGDYYTFNESPCEYTLVRFSDLYNTFCQIVENCGINYNIFDIPIDTIFTPIFNNLIHRDKYWRTIHGNNMSIRLCIFLYASYIYDDSDLIKIQNEFNTQEKEQIGKLNIHFKNHLKI
jgi:hypothetical protein